MVWEGELMGSSGDHTFPIEVFYEQCPHCGKVFESRKRYEYKKGLYFKQEQCPYCSKEFTREKKAKTKGPLFGEAPKPEMEWGDR